ncbi:MAG: SusC/RagA family TonB-linked outer membrane protein [Tannerella sp.]|jgi:TonB-linked SusC/RagA family outer membrane protein|nr:SusC/RagA family TonB-linked outer membrane protein [Tannerella sp.]
MGKHGVYKKGLKSFFLCIKSASILVMILSFTFITQAKVVELSDRSFEDNQQARSVTGVVTDESGEALSGVLIKIKGTTQGTISESDGHFEIRNVPENGILEFSYIGMQTEEINVGNRMHINVVLKEDVIGLVEVVAIGYGTMKKSDLTGSVSQISAENFKTQPLTQFTEILSGTVAGFYSKQSTGASGGGSMQVRGPNSLTASTSPLIVVDGVIFNGSVGDINPNDIQTIDVLKDASSAAVYGAKAASGVILITTTKGKKGKPTINLSVKNGFSSALNQDFMARSPEEYMEFRKNYYRTLGNNVPDYYWFSPNNLPQGVTLEQWRNAANNPNADNTLEWLSRMNFFPEERDNYLAGNIVNWQDQVFRNGYRQEYDASIGGGNENATYYISLGYVDNEGIIVGDDFSAFRTRINGEYKITNWIKTGVNAQYAIRDESSVTATLSQASVQSPYGQVYNDDGTVNWFPYGYSPSPNPLINTYGQDRLRKIHSLFSALYAELTLPFGFSYRFSFQPRIENLKDYNYWSPETQKGAETYPNGRVERTDNSVYEWMIDNLVKWNKTIGVHSFDFTFLYNAEKKQTWSSFGSNYDIQPTSILGYHGMQYGAYPYVKSDDTRVTGDALMGRLNYTLQDKYLFTGTVRRDGYSAFGTKHPRATFPALSAAWQLSRENFYNELWFMNKAKMRFSWGRSGNRDIGIYSALSSLDLNNYYNGNSVQVGLTGSRLANNELKWEETESFNIGLDLGFMSNRIELTADIYATKTNNLLVNRVLPKITGYSSIMTNIGQVKNKGIELTVTSRNFDTPNFSWKSTLTYSMNRNEITKLFGDVSEYVLEGQTHVGEIPDYTNKWFPGHAIDEIWDYDIIGVWQVGEEEEAAKYGLKPGDYRVRDMDENSKYEALQDKTFIGYKNPRHRFGLINEFTILSNIKVFLFLRSDLGHKMAFNQSVASWSMFDRQNTQNYPYWTFENQSNEWPRLNNNLTPFGGGVTPYKSASFLRLQDLSISYNFSNIGKYIPTINRISVFVSGRNLLTFSKWSGYDPENSDNTTMYRTLSFGLNATF